MSEIVVVHDKPIRLKLSNGEIVLGGQKLCHEPVEREAVIHACKRPCFDASWVHHPPETMIAQYVRQDDRELWLNMIDHPTLPLFKIELWEHAHRFMRRYLDRDFRVCIHCNMGMSRSTSIVMTYLIRTRQLGFSDELTLEEALEKFTTLYPSTALSGGIESFMTQWWETLCQELP